MVRLAAIILVASLASLGPATGELSAQAPAERRNFPAQPGDTLVIQNDYGRVQITAWDSILVDAQIRRNTSGQAGKESPRVVAQKSGTRIFVYSFFSGSGGESVDLEIRAPGFMNVVAWGANPEIDLRGIQGFVRAQTFTGGIFAEDLVGSVSLISDTGDILLRNVAQPRGDARLETNSGNIRCEPAEKLNLRAWLRAGGTIAWDKEPGVKATSMEKQLGTFGPLLYAGSLKGNVVVSLRDAVVTPTSPTNPPEPKPPKRETPGADNLPPDAPRERPRLSRGAGARTNTPAQPDPAADPQAPTPRTHPSTSPPADPPPDSPAPSPNPLAVRV